jgi:hypothetical protein
LASAFPNVTGLLRVVALAPESFAQKLRCVLMLSVAPAVGLFSKYRLRVVGLSDFLFRAYSSPTFRFVDVDVDLHAPI